MKIKNLCCVALLAMTLVFSSIKADCNPDPKQMAQTLKDLCWECFFPLYIAGQYVYKGNMPDVRGRTLGANPICVCEMPIPPFIRIGFPIGYFEASRMIDVVKDPYCFQGLGFKVDYDKVATMGGLKLGGTKAQAQEKGDRAFMQAHYVMYPVMESMELFTDTLCLNWGVGIDIAYMTEIDPLWQDDELMAFLQPEALLFGNPISNLACIADATAAQINTPLDPLFWCKGSWGNAYPLTGNTLNKDYVEDAASIAASLIYKLHREAILWESSGYPTVAGVCYDYPMPFWLKSSYRLQIISPMPHFTAVGIGKSGILWDFAKNIPFVKDDNFSFMLFKKKECCML